MTAHGMKTGHAVPASKGALQSSAKAHVRTALTPERRNQMIEIAAYYRAEQRGFAAGSELDDWLAAEREVDAMIAGVPQASMPAARAPGAGANAALAPSAKASAQKGRIRA